MRIGLAVFGVILGVAGLLTYQAFASDVTQCNSLAGKLEQDLDPSYQQECSNYSLFQEIGEAAGVIGGLLFIVGLVVAFIPEEKPASPQAPASAALPGGAKWRCAKCGYTNTAVEFPLGRIPTGSKIHCSACGTLNTIG